MSTETDLVTSIYRAFNTGDIARVIATFDPDIEWRTPSSLPWSAGTYCGPEEVAGYFQSFGQALADAAVEPDVIEGTGEVVVARGFERAVARSTGRGFSARFAHVWRVVGDRVVSMEGVVDTATIVAAFGDRPRPSIEA